MRLKSGCRLFNKLRGKVAIARFLTILRAPKTTRGQLPRVKFGALRKRKSCVKGSIIIRFLPIRWFNLVFNDF